MLYAHLAVLVGFQGKNPEPAAGEVGWGGRYTASPAAATAAAAAAYSGLLTVLVACWLSVQRVPLFSQPLAVHATPRFWKQRNFN